jgi:hypothetical protein
MFPTAIISGRGREKVESFVRLPELFYAGSHGMDIVGPCGATVGSTAGGGVVGGGSGDGGVVEQFRFQAAAEYQPLIDRVYSQLRERCGLWGREWHAALIRRARVFGTSRSHRQHANGRRRSRQGAALEH